MTTRSNSQAAAAEAAAGRAPSSRRAHKLVAEQTSARATSDADDDDRVVDAESYLADRRRARQLCERRPAAYAAGVVSLRVARDEQRLRHELEFPHWAPLVVRRVQEAAEEYECLPRHLVLVDPDHLLFPSAKQFEKKFSTLVRQTRIGARVPHQRIGVQSVPLATMMLILRRCVKEEDAKLADNFASHELLGGKSQRIELTMDIFNSLFACDCPLPRLKTASDGSVIGLLCAQPQQSLGYVTLQPARNKVNFFFRLAYYMPATDGKMRLAWRTSSKK